MAVKEQRKRPRHSTGLDVRICWQDSAGKLLDAPAIVRNVSDTGLGVEVNDRFPEGTLLSITTHEGSLQGVVRHVQEQYSSYFTGIEILGTSGGIDHLRSLENLLASEVGDGHET